MVTIKLDWDNITLKTAGKRMAKIYDGLGVYPRLFKTQHGYHCYVKTTKRINPDEMFVVRAYYQDDPLRIMLDKVRLKQGMDYDVLFQDFEFEVSPEQVTQLVNRHSFIKSA
tara:strand:- start:225 stop:560 length:336 start_codon:yes stop_codon:yes gene_type:complete